MNSLRLFAAQSSVVVAKLAFKVLKFFFVRFRNGEKYKGLGSPEIRAFYGLFSAVAIKKFQDGRTCATNLHYSLCGGIYKGGNAKFDKIPATKDYPNKSLWTLPKGTKMKDHKNVILYVHGGGYGGGSAEAYSDFCGTLSARCNALVLDVDYSLAPKAPIREAQRQLLDTYKLLVKAIPQDAKVAIVGDSAGGGHALGLARAIVAQNNLKQLECCALLSPWADLDGTYKNDNIAGDKDCVFAHESFFVECGKYVCQESGKPPSDPENSLIHGSYEKLPNLLVTCGKAEKLFGDSERIVSLAQSAGVNVQVDFPEHCQHDFQIFSLSFDVPEFKQGLHRLCDYLTAHLSD